MQDQSVTLTFMSGEKKCFISLLYISNYYNDFAHISSDYYKNSKQIHENEPILTNVRSSQESRLFF